MRRRQAAALLLPMTVLMTACSASVSVGTTSVEQAEVEQTISDELEALVGRAPESVTCPGDLPGTVGETMRCSLEDGGATLGVTVTVTTVEGTEVGFDFEVDEEPS